MVKLLVCESVDIRGISRILKIAAVTILRRIERIAAQIPKPPFPRISRALKSMNYGPILGARKMSTGWHTL